MARSSSNFSILAEVELDTSTIQKQLNNLGSKIKFDSTTLKDAQKSMDDLGNSAEKAGDKVADTALNFNAANEIFQNTLTKGDSSFNAHPSRLFYECNSSSNR